VRRMLREGLYERMMSREGMIHLRRMLRERILREGMMLRERMMLR